jgi:CxxC motif-containing protein (DUF1111 family)
VTPRSRALRLGAGLLPLALVAACVRPPNPGDPIRGLSRVQREQFDRGRAVVEREFEPDTGLGPLFNAPACGECHEDPVAGGGGDEVERHVGLVNSDGTCDSLVERGGPVMQQVATPALREALGIDSEPVPPGAALAGRSTPDLLGFGLLDAVPDAAILAHADPDDRDHDGISGRPNRFFDGRLGRFGRKAIVPSLRDFNDGAFVIEQGVTNPAVPVEETIGGSPIPAGVDPVPEPEIDQRAIDDTDAFVRFLAAPARRSLDREGRRGRDLFATIRCVGCHVPTLETGEDSIEPLRKKKVAAYTDLLLHDMGLELADICLGDASPSEFRTEPLMGLRLNSRFLHDARAATVREAIELHGGEAAASRDRFRSLSEKDRAALLKFLDSL